MGAKFESLQETSLITWLKHGLLPNLLSSSPVYQEYTIQRPLPLSFPFTSFQINLSKNSINLLLSLNTPPPFSMNFIYSQLETT